MLATHVLRSGERALFDHKRETVTKQPKVEWSLADPNTGDGWEANPVEVEAMGGVLTPEEVLRRQLNSMGAEGERYDYINFEGTSRTQAVCWPWQVQVRNCWEACEK